MDLSGVLGNDHVWLSAPDLALSLLCTEVLALVISIVVDPDRSDTYG